MALLSKSSNYQAQNTQTSTGSDTSEHKGACIHTVNIWIYSIRAYTAHTKNPFMPKVSAAEEHKHVNRSSLGSLAQHRTRCTKTASSKEHKEVHLVSQ